MTYAMRAYTANEQSLVRSEGDSRLVWHPGGTSELLLSGTDHQTKMSLSFPEVAAAPSLQTKMLLVRSVPHHLQVVRTATSMTHTKALATSFPVQTAEVVLQIQLAVSAAVDALNTVLLACQINASVLK